MSHDYGDMMRESAERRRRDELLREWGNPDDPADYAVELAEGRRAKDELQRIKHALYVLRKAAK